MESKITYCPECGEYLGDSVDGVLYKFGKAITEPHVCKHEQKTAYKVGKSEIEKKHPHFFED